MNQLISNLLMQPRPTNAVERPQRELTLIDKLEQERDHHNHFLETCRNDRDKAYHSFGKKCYQEAIDIVKKHQPTTVYELIYEGGEGYYSIMHSLDKAVCERFIEQVREYDAKFKNIHSLSYDDDNRDALYDAWEENHPLRQWSDEIHGEYNAMGYYLAEDGFKSYARNLRINEYTLDKAENK